MEPDWDVINKAGWKNKADKVQLIQYFKEKLEHYPNSSRAYFELANALDFADQEEKAIPLYEKAIKLGLSREFEAYAYLQLGSSLKNLGRLEAAINVLTKAHKRFPDFASINIFLCLALHDNGQQSEAMINALSAILNHVHTMDIERYRYVLEDRIKSIYP